MARKILLADDSVTAQNMGRKILADAGYEVITVNNGSAALKRVAEQKPDLVILDVYMPGYSGLEVCQRLKEAAETAHTPILLTVGKLEPFKPEEAKRVRADGFIVKPFEASELLSALSKLEDKIVPRSEPSKPGRFARAFAAVEQADRPSKSEAESAESGWKERIAFPSKKSKSAESEDDSETYNAVNRDLRTVVDKEEKKKKKKEKEREEDPKPSLSKVDVAAIAPEGLPQDVTPEEIAAIAAAAAQVQAKSGATDSEKSSDAEHATSPEDTSVKAEQGIGATEEKLEAKPVAETSGPEQTRPAVAENQPESAEEVGATFAAQTSEPKDEAASGISEKEGEDRKKLPRVAGNDADVMAAIAALEPANGKAWDADSSDHVLPHVSERSAEHASPGTTATTAETGGNGTGPRWMAVPVTLHGDEAAISLEHEMQKAYAAFAAAEGSNGSLVGSVRIMTDETSEPLVSAQKSEAAPEAAEKSGQFANDPPMVAGETMMPVPVAPAVSEVEVDHDNTQSSDDAPAPAVPEIPQTVETAAVAQVVEGTAREESSNDPSAVVAEEVANKNASEAASMPDMASAVAEVTAGWNNSEAEGPHEMAQQKDSEMAATTAAAWASWRQIRDTDTKASPTAEQAKEFADDESASQPESAAMAVAAGAEKSPEDASATPSTESNNIASIVDSVMAELRPKIVAEISKKLAAEKK